MGLNPSRCVVSRVVDASRRTRHARVRVVHAEVLQTINGIAHRVAPQRVVFGGIRRARGARGALVVDDALVSRAPAIRVPVDQRVIAGRARRAANTRHAHFRLDSVVHGTRAVGLRPRRIVSRVVDASRRTRHARVRVVHAVVCRTRGALRVRAVVGIVHVHRAACVAIRARSAGAGGGAISQVLVRTARGEQSSTASGARSHVRGSRRYAGVPLKGGLPDRRRQGGQHPESERANRHADSCA